MRDPERLSQLAREAGAYAAERLPTVEPPRRDSLITSPVDSQDAKVRLVSRRTGSVYYKDPSKQKRNVFRSKKEKAELADTDRWTYTTAERFAALDEQIREGGAVGLAQALITFDPSKPLNVNITYVSDAKGNASATNNSSGWLELVAARDDVQYVRLLTSYGADQASKDRALGVALEHKAMQAVAELLRNDANPNINGIDHFHTAIRDKDTRMIQLFLTAMHPIEPMYINEVLPDAVGNPDLVAILFAHGADGAYNYGEALCVAITGDHIQDAAIILLHSIDNLSQESLDRATSVACSLVHDESKHRFLDLLLSSGADANTGHIQDTLFDAVKKSHIPLVTLLINHTTSPDRNDAEAIRYAIEAGQVELFDILLQGSVSEQSASRTLMEAKSLGDDEKYEHIVTALVEKGVQQHSLSVCLADCVEREIGSLAPMLIEKGADLEYSDALCVRLAIQQNNFDLLRVLLTGPCSPEILCKVLPIVMAVQPPYERYNVMSALLDKGVSGRELHVFLQHIVRDASNTFDYRLIDLLIQKKASVDFADDNGNCVQIAAAREDEKALDLLCQGNPSQDTASIALGYITPNFAAADSIDYERTLRIINTLLVQRAQGESTAEMLIHAVRDDYRGKVLDVLIGAKANVNYKQGKAIEEALGLPKSDALKLICEHLEIEKSTFTIQIPNALKPDGFNLVKLSLLLSALARAEHQNVLDQPLLDEVKVNGSRIPVVEILLQYGANVNYQDGEVLRRAVEKGQLDVCRLLLAANPTKPVIKLAYPSTALNDREVRYHIMEALLQRGGSNIGQNEALIQASKEAINYDLTHVELLLQHSASPNYKDGAAVLESIRTKNLPLLNRFVGTQLKENTLNNAFTLARKLKCSRDERYNIYASLLKAAYDGYEVSKALLEAVVRDPFDTETPVLLLRYGASVEFQNGLAMQTAATAGSLQLLNIFIEKQPSQSCRDNVFAHAIYELDQEDKRMQVYQILLRTGISQDFISQALLQATYRSSTSHELLNQLIDFGASLDFESGAALDGVCAKGDVPTLEVLLRAELKQNYTLNRSFTTAMKAQKESRLIMAKLLLNREPGVSRETTSHHLVQVVGEADHELLDLIMEHKPDPSYNSGESLVLSAQNGDAAAAALLVKVQIPNETANQAFEQMLNHRTIRSQSSGLKTAGILLELNIDQMLRDRALLDDFDDPIDQLTKDVVELLIPYKPDFSVGDGKCFVDSAKAGETEFFRRMASQKPDLNIVIQSMIRSFEKQEDLIPFLEHLEDCGERGNELLHHSVLFTAMGHFPEGRDLIKYLLDHGCPADSLIDAELDLAGETETMTAIIWALSRAEPEISEEVIMEILERGKAGKSILHHSMLSHVADGDKI
jgi:ankyrin repeat protein